MLHGLYFGAILNYRSPVDGYLTRCVYVREENNKAVVIFKRAERVTKVNYDNLEWANKYEDTLRGMDEYLRQLGDT